MLFEKIVMGSTISVVILFWWAIVFSINRKEIIKVKKLNKDAVVPKQMTDGAAGYDLTAITMKTSPILNYVEYGTGLAFQIPKGHVGLLFQRSSVSNMDMSLSNAVGVLDSDFTGEVTFRYRQSGPNIYKVGDRIGQLVVVPLSNMEMIEVDELDKTQRGEGGYGST